MDFCFCRLFGLLYINIMASVNKKQFYFFLSNQYTFYLFSCLIVLARTLNRNDERRYLCLFTYLRGKGSCLSPFCTMLAVGFLCILIFRLLKFSKVLIFLQPTKCRWFVLIRSIERFDL